MSSGLKSYPCSICGKKLSTKGQMYKCMATHDKPNKCVLCEQTCKEQNNLFGHYSRIHGTKKVSRCPLFDCSTSKNEMFKQHLISVHKIGPNSKPGVMMHPDNCCDPKIDAR